jgi:hypothetical protein
MLRHHAHLDLPAESAWLVPGIIPENGLVVLASAPKTGKSVFANAIARAMASGGEFDGDRWNIKVPVAWCAHEETPEERGPYLAGLTEDDPFYLAFPPDLPCLDDAACDHHVDRYGRYQPANFPYVYSMAEKRGVRLLVIDSLHAAVRHSNLADNSVARKLMGKLRHWSTAFGISTLVLHHLTKHGHRGYHPDRFADSAQILASASAYFYLESEILEDGRRKVVLHGAGRQPAPPSRQEFIADGYFDYRRVSFDTSRKAVPIAEQIRRLLQEGWELSAEEIATRLGKNPASVRNVLVSLPGIAKIESSKRKFRYRLEAPEGEE